MDMEWKWAKANEKDLARFVNEKAIELLDKLPIENRVQLLTNPDGRRAIVKAIYETLVNKNIQYALEKYQPEDETQLIRTPVEILSTPGEGTCLDLSLLFCSLCFGYGLLPLLIVIEGHAFAAISLKHQQKDWKNYAPERSMFETFDLFQGETNLSTLKKLVEDDAYIAIECTGFAHSELLGTATTPETKYRENGVLSFGLAYKAGAEQLENPNRKFKFAIDIAAAKYMWGIKAEEIPNLSATAKVIHAEANLTYENFSNGEATGIDATDANLDNGANLITNITTQNMTGGTQIGVKLRSVNSRS
jgi:hypothetical protein